MSICTHAYARVSSHVHTRSMHMSVHLTRHVCGLIHALAHIHHADAHHARISVYTHVHAHVCTQEKEADNVRPIDPTIAVTCLYTFLRTSLHTCLYACPSTCLHMSTHKSMHVSTCALTHVHSHVYAHVYTCAHTRVHTHVYTRAHIHAHAISIHMPTHTSTHRRPPMPGRLRHPSLTECAPPFF